jgi:peptide/nickel transport system substrate-binding protein
LPIRKEAFGWMKTPTSQRSTPKPRAKRRELCALLVVSTVLLVGGATSDTRIIYVEEDLPTTMNPLFPSNDTDRRAHRLVFDYLYERSVVTEGYRSRVIETVTPNPDGKTFQLSLKKGVRWHDKEPMKAADICFSIGALQHQDTPTTLPLPAAITSCEPVDEHTLTLAFEAPIADLPAHLTFPLIPQHHFESSSIPSDHPFALTPVGSGLMRARLDERNNWQLEAHKSPHVSPHIQSLQLEAGGDLFAQTQLMLAGAIDGMIRVPPSFIDEIAASTALALQPTPSDEWWFIALNTSKQPLSNSTIRWSIDAILNRSELRLAGLGEDPDTIESTVHWMTGPFLPDSGYANQSLYPKLRSNPEQAAQRLTKAGLKRLPNAGSWLYNDDALRLHIGVLESVDRLAPQFTQVLGKQLRSGGIEAVFKTISDEDWQQASRLGLDSSLDMLVGKSEHSGIQGVKSLFHSTGEDNFFRYSNPAADRLIDGVLATPDSTEAHYAAWELHTLIAQDRPYLFLWKLEAWSAWAVHVQPIIITPDTYFADFESWNVKPK